MDTWHIGSILAIIVLFISILISDIYLCMLISMIFFNLDLPLPSSNTHSLNVIFLQISKWVLIHTVHYNDVMPQITCSILKEFLVFYLFIYLDKIVYIK